MQIVKSPSERGSVLAHVKQREDGSWQEHILEEHLSEVARLACEFARPFGADQLALLAGLWHDLGKYSAEFQERIRLKSGYDVEAHLEGKTTLHADHSTAGGIYAIEKIGAKGRVIAFPILGHHTGLQDMADVERRLHEGQHEKKFVENIREKIDPIIADPTLQIAPRAVEPTFFIRMLFSCLVDADFLDTERFFDPSKSALRSGGRTINQIAERLREFLKGVSKGARKTPVNTLREEVRLHVEKQVAEKPGFFTLTVPTGGGKTLTSLSFAVGHALEHDKKRIIYAIPYTSIIEQTAAVFRNAVGDEAVLEHHSNLDPASFKSENPRTRMISENWDASLIVTTTVQLFESLFSRKTSRCRKLHNIANSVIILDEAQLLPPDFLAPVLKCLNELVKNYGVTVVFCTATQPALESVRTTHFKDGIEGARELAPNPENLHLRLRRVRIELLNGSIGTATPWDVIAPKVNEHETALVIVSTRRDARELWGALSPSAVHLSTWMCGQHRSDTLARIKDSLKQGAPIRVVSTQLVEAGVDVDFPVVFRALTGLDSIAQAAGRCNREGLLEFGQVYVFTPPRSAPPGHLRQMEQAGKAALSEGGDFLAPERFRKYFRELFWLKGESLDRKKILELMQTFQFEQIHGNFRIIEEDATPLLVPYADGARLAGELVGGALDFSILRRAQRFLVNVRRRDVEKLVRDRSAILVEETIAVLTNAEMYDPILGLIMEDTTYHDPGGLIL